jgi:penicillin amidase
MLRRSLLGLTVVFAGCSEEEAATPPPTPLASYSAQAPIQVRFDDLGMAHIRGADALDTFFGAGYQQAVDRLFEIEVSRRSAVGTLSAVLGPDRLGTDRQSRTFNFRALGEATVERLARERVVDHNLLVAFVGGINRRVAEIRAGEVEAPPGFAAAGFAPEPFTPAEIMAIGVRIQFGFSSTLEFDLLYTVLQRLAPGAERLPVFMPVGTAVITGSGVAAEALHRRPPALRGVPDPADLRALKQALRSYRRDLGVGEGSNSWAVHGDHTFNGRPILANDSHSRLRDPNVMYPFHMTAADGSFDVQGMAFVGVPGVHVGHNRHLVWGATTHFADVLDLFDVDVSAEGALLGSERVPVRSRTEVIEVAGSPAVTLEVQEIPGRGVFLPAELLPLPKGLVAEGELMLVWPGFEPTLDLSVFLDLNRARTLDDFQAAIEGLATGMQNWTAATAEGIRYRAAGRVPDRGTHFGTPNQVQDAANPQVLWTGKWMDLARLPALDGDRPFIVTANNDVFGHTLDNDPLNDGFYYGSFFAPGFRAARIEAALTEQIAAGPIDLEATRALQLEVLSTYADRLLALVAQVPPPADPDAQAAAATLLAWDRQMTPESAPAALFRLFAGALQRALLADDLSLLYDAIEEAEPVYIAKFTLLTLEQALPELLDGPLDALIHRALAEAAAEHARRGAPTWGDLHRAELTRTDGTTRLLVTGGDDSSVNVAQTRCFAGDPPSDFCVSESGAVYRMVTSFDEAGRPQMTFNCPACLPEGDEDWVAGRYRPLAFTEAEVEARTVRRVVVEP